MEWSGGMDIYAKLTPTQAAKTMEKMLGNNANGLKIDDDLLKQVRQYYCYVVMYVCYVMLCYAHKSNFAFVFFGLSGGRSIQSRGGESKLQPYLFFNFTNTIFDFWSAQRQGVGRECERRHQNYQEEE